MKLKNKEDIATTILVLVAITSITTFGIGILAEDTVLALIGAVLYYFMIAYLLVIGWKGGFENEHEDT